MSTALLDAVVKKNRVRLIPFMLALYVRFSTVRISVLPNRPTRLIPG